MRSELTVRGCLNATIGLFLLLLLCFVVGLAAQVGWRAMARVAAPAASPTPLVLPTPLPAESTAPVEALPSPPPPATPTSEPSATAAPTRTPEPRPTRRPSVTPTATPGTRTYSVQEGDTFFSIARQFELSVEALSAANPTVNPELLNVGDELTIPPP